jgi:hypothetical protein
MKMKMHRLNWSRARNYIPNVYYRYEAFSSQLPNSNTDTDYGFTVKAILYHLTKLIPAEH